MQNRLTIAAGCIALAAVLGACADSPTGPGAEDLPPGIAASHGSSTSADDRGGASSGSELRVETMLASVSAAFPSAKGKAKFRSRGGERELQIEVENLRPGAVVTFLLDGVALPCAGSSACTATADAFGEARIELNTDGGAGVAGTNVPESVSGRTVAASVGGRIVVQGRFD